MIRYKVGDIMEDGTYKAGIAVTSDSNGVRIECYQGHGGSSTGWSWKYARKLRDMLTKALRKWGR